MGKSDWDGSNKNSFSIGSVLSAGARLLELVNSAGKITFSGTPTANRTITVPDASGTIALTSDLAAVTTSGSGLILIETIANGATLADSHNGKLLLLPSSNPATLNLPQGLPVGFNCMIKQTGNGQITFLNASGTTFHNYYGHNKTAGLRAVASLIVTATNQFTLGGETSV